ncbi:membrane protein insertase YidC [Janthinobacterium sp. 17J80-10]|uniref:membrane protein insertase YidC n=1 Tax=Janthinobacterium sp. 17J80-10 TaxID=2497863 RepID=UPI0010056099|nr:membrane protein insertase YidC [Janthinobacterium sp. 17J80-10]QAU33114.1 membrane protein insertase YidC [Janthinobacterium sp. 17J80-10]
MDIRRTFLWVIFSMSIILLWDNWMRYNGKPSMFFPSATQQAAPAAGAGSTAQTGLPQAGQAAVQAAPGTPSGIAAPAAGQAAVKTERILITTDLFKAQVDTLGGNLVHLELLQHKEGAQSAKNVALFDESRNYAAQTGLIGGPFPNHKSAFVARPGARALDGGNQVQLVLEAEQNGVKLVKTFTFTRGSYVIDIKHEVVNASGAPVTPTAYLQLVRDNSKLPGESMFYSTFTGPAVYTDAAKFHKVSFEDIEKGKAPKAAATNDGWASMVQHYFVSAILPQDKAPREIYTDKVATNQYSVGTKLPLGTVAPGATAAVNAQLYAGPQESARLEKFAPGFDLVKDYGWLTVVAKPIFWLMTQIQKVISNWGWTIIALTVLIKLAFFPLTAASYRSMAKMKTVTPKMQSIRERHKGDPQKMNQAMMELYKTEKINPLGGCLPMVIQMPVFIALYWVLLASVEMRNAPWIGWIHDLASPDPFYILPVVMAASMFLQTRLNPTPPDPMQAKMMMWMPIIFSVMFFFFPAGLVLYWVVNNILSIGQQWLINKKMKA